MKPTILSQSGHTTYGIKDFVVDTDKDIENLPTDISTGSTVLSIESGNVFILNSKNKWKPITAGGGNNSQSSDTSGPGISAALINEKGHLIITTSAGTTIDAGLAKGADGQSFTFDDLTEEQKAALKGDKGDTFTFDDLTEEQKATLKGEPGHSFTFDDLTEEQKNQLKGEPGKDGKDFQYEDFTPAQLAALTGPPGERGQPFQIAKTYPTIEAMNNDFSNPNVLEGQFVIISSNIEETDNAKLYLKGETEFSFITDLSGASGIQGEPGPQGIGIKKGVINEENHLILTLTDNTQIDTGYVKGDPGSKGDPGIGILNISYDENGNLLITLTNNETSGPFKIKGDPGTPGAKGDKGDNYTLTSDDKTQIAEIVLNLLPRAEGESF